MHGNKPDPHEPTGSHEDKWKSLSVSHHLQLSDEGVLLRHRVIKAPGPALREAEGGDLVKAGA